MGILTLFRFLLGHRDAIHTVATTRHAWLVALLFVLAAGFAREYDGEDLLHQPWHLALPLLASTTLATILFLLCRLGLTKTPDYPGFGRAYLAFLTCFWMIAPLAFFYAIPYEQFLSAGDAVTLNLWTLAIVATWRVLLFSRIIGVLLGTPVGGFFVIMFVGDVTLLTLLSCAKLPVIQIMGGIRLTEREAALASTAFRLTALAFLTSPIWLIGAISALTSRKMAWRIPNDAAHTPVSGWPEGPPGPATADPSHSPRPSLPLISLALASLLIWPFILPLTQPQQQRRRHVEDLFRANDIPAALAAMSAQPRDAFPPHWDPPPRPGYGDDRTLILDICDHLTTHDAAPWVRAVYLEKLDRYFLDRYSTRFYNADFPAAYARVTALLDVLPEGPDLRKQRQEELEWWRQVIDVNEEPTTQSHTRPTTTQPIFPSP